MDFALIETVPAGATADWVRKQLEETNSLLRDLMSQHAREPIAPVELVLPERGQIARRRGRRARRGTSRSASRSGRGSDPEPPPDAPSALPQIERFETDGARASSGRALGAATFRTRSANSKLSPVVKERVGAKRTIRPVEPFCCSTYVSIAATCGETCRYKNNGCYVTEGATKKLAAGLDRAAMGFTSDQVIAEEARLILRSFRGGKIPRRGWKAQGLDLRLHVGGDVGSESGARTLAAAAADFIARSGGAVWTYTEAWRRVPREAWGPISVLASVARPEDVEAARAAGYAAAIVVNEFPEGPRAFLLPGTSAVAIPCPAESGAGSKVKGRATTCVECRLCLDRDLLGMGRVIAFAAHGPGAGKVTTALAQLRATRDGRALSAREGIRAPESSAAMGAVLATERRRE